MKTRLLALLEIGAVYAALQVLALALRSTGIMQWELEVLGWSYLAEILFIAVPASVIVLTHRPRADYGVSLQGWPTNLDLGMKAYLLRFLPMSALLATLLLGIGYRGLRGGALVAFADLLAIGLLLWILPRHRSVASGGHNLIISAALLLFPILLGWAMHRLTLIVFSTVLWQCFSGFGEEFVWRGYVQSRLNQGFGRPYRLFGIQFGPGLLLASLLFGLLHAFNTYDGSVGWASLSWGWALFTTTGGLFFGILPEKTGSLVAPGVAHALPDAVGEALGRVMGWM